MLVDLSETTAKIYHFFPRASGFCIRTRGSRCSVLRSASTRWSGEVETGRGKGEMNSGTRGSEFSLRHAPFATSGSSTILIDAADAPMDNWPLTSEVCSLLVFVTIGAVPVVPTVPWAVPFWGFEVTQTKRGLKQWCWFNCRLVGGNYTLKINKKDYGNFVKYNLNGQ